MTSRLRKRIGCCLLGFALLLGGVLVALHHFLPGVLARRVIAAMAEAGLRDPNIRFRALGLWRTQVADLRAGADAWRVELDAATARYDPLALLDARIDTLELAGLRIDWTPAMAGAPALEEPSLVPSTNALLELWPDRVPLTRLTLSEGLLRIHGNDQTRSMNLTAGVTVTNDATLFVGRVGGPEQAASIRFEASVAKEGLSRGSAAFEVRNPTEWLALVPAISLPAAAQTLTTSPFSGTLAVAIRAGASAATLTGTLEPLRLTSTPAGNATVAVTTASATLGRAGLVEASLRSGFGLTLRSGAQCEIPTLSLALDAAQRLTGQAADVRITLPDTMQAEGDLRVMIDDAFAGASASGDLEFNVRTLSLPGLALEPFAGEVRGGVDALNFSIPDLTLPGFGRWHLTGLTGEVRQPFAAEASLTAHGRLAGQWSSNVIADEALPFRIEARREGEQATGTLSLSLTNVLLSAFATGPPARISGALSLGANLKTNRSEFSTRFDLALTQLTVAGGSFDDLALTGEAQLTRNAPSQPPLPGFVLRFLPVLPGLASDLLADSGADVRGQAGGVRFDNGLSLQEPRLHLVRLPASTGSAGAWARIELGAASLNWRGFRIAPLQVVGSLEDDWFHLEGSGSVAGQPCPFTLDLRVTDGDPGGADLIGQLSLGPLRLQDYPIPRQWTSGDDVRITGEAMIESPVRFAADGRLGAAPRLVLDLAKVEWPARKLVLEHLHTTLALVSIDPPESRSGEIITVDRVAYDTHELTDVTLGFELMSEARIRLQLVEASLLDGRVHSAPFVWHLPTGDFEMSLNLENVDLEPLSRTIPHWDGTVTGRLDGRIPLSRKAGQWRTAGGRLELNRAVAASLHYPAQGLLTGGMDPASPRYDQLKLVEAGLENLALQALALDVCDPKTPGTPLRIHLEGTSTSAQVIVPVILNLNFNGQFAEVLRLLNTGDFEWSF